MRGSMRVAGLVLAMAGIRLAAADLIEQLSFAAPFHMFESDGTRKINAHFRVHGASVVNENFIRVTPDRQSRRGAIWSRTSVGRTSFSGNLRFRISGSGKKFFGDGLALWITQQPRAVAGDFHGNTARFTGIGIIFDTFKNTEMIDKHRDVALVYNDGTMSQDQILEKVMGCDAQVRFYEKRQDFDVTQATRAKVEISGRHVKVLIDEHEEGDWKECVETSLPEEFKEDWLLTAHVGITASTGQLADNHDVLSFQAFSDMGVARLFEEMEKEREHFETDPDDPVDVRVEQIEETLNDLLARLEKYEHEMEHKIVGVDDHIRNIVGKLENREDEAEHRIEELEDRITMTAQSDTIRRLERLEKEQKEYVESSLKAREAAMDSRFNNLDLGGGWQIPFGIIVLLLAGAAFGMYRYHLYLRKTHLL